MFGFPCVGIAEHTNLSHWFIVLVANNEKTLPDVWVTTPKQVNIVELIRDFYKKQILIWYDVIYLIPYKSFIFKTLNVKYFERYFLQSFVFLIIWHIADKLKLFT